MKFAAILLFFSIDVYCHPHVFVDADIELKRVETKGIVAKVRWYFDEYTSEALIGDYDINRNGKIDKLEVKTVIKDFSKNLRQYQHFTTLMVNGKKEKIKVTNSGALIGKRAMSANIRAAVMEKKAKEIISFSYYFQFQIPIKTGNGVISFYDDTIYSVIFPVGKMKFAKDIVIKKSKLVESRCEYHFEISS